MWWRIFNFPLSEFSRVENVGSSRPQLVFPSLNFIRQLWVSSFSSGAFRYRQAPMHSREDVGDVELPFFVVNSSCCLANWFYCYWTCCYFPWLFQKDHNFGERSYPLSDLSSDDQGTYFGTFEFTFESWNTSGELASRMNAVLRSFSTLSFNQIFVDLFQKWYDVSYGCSCSK